MVRSEHETLDVIRRSIDWKNKNDMTKPAGKMFVQKIAFISKTRGASVDYDFSLYTYGPFSREIMDDIDQLEEKEEIEVKWNDRFEGYEVFPRLLKFSTDRIDPVLEKTLERYGSMSARSLELLSIIIYVINDNITGDDVIRTVKKVKPMFSEDEIIEMIKMT